MNKHVPDEHHHFVVVMHKRHLHVQTYELSQMPAQKISVSLLVLQ
jgi:hypothetical protein